ncbi:CLUMA_CG019566, isoform A [Clunio marinus]|uniref:CLUMA_CG019566, isoform A n=1 Tax=Clunio marinus TaxID=568069 RepID=A0A1J1J4H5_9DIPT|nr:CLUMA_CG019566, isoform A [Clunio marinus]
MTMSRSPLILLMVLIASSLTVDAQSKNRDRYFDDFRGQSFCASRQRGPQGSCCSDRIDECSVPIAGTLCYCDEFCDQHINPDCCPDYERVCLGAPEPIEARCDIGNGILISSFEEAKSNCNLCKCRANGVADCEKDACLSDDDVINRVNRDSSSLGWKAFNYSEFYGRKLKEGFEYRLGTFEPRIRVKSMSRLTNRLEDLPREFNSLSNWAGSISEIRDQGWCGSSWAVSTASVASDRFGIKAKTAADLSAQHLLSCVRHQQGCHGGHLDNAWRYLNRYGVADEDCYGYEAEVGRCRVKKGDNLQTLMCSIPEERAHDGFYKMGPAYSLNNETDIMWEIFHYGPVQATMWVYPDFFNYRSGIYRRSNHGENAKGFHSVRLVGWGEERFGWQTTKYWVAANSWGRWWGESGFFKILRGENECNIENYVLSSLADVHEGKPNSRQVKRAGRRASRNSQIN